MSTQTVTIDRLGSGGDGIAGGPDGPIYVPFTLPGETVAIAKVKAHGTVISTSVPSPDRIAPACRHFGPDGVGGTCGGCSLQHASDDLYHAFKRGLVVDALKSKGLMPEVAPLVIARPAERRRVVFTARQTEKALLLGFNQAGSHHIVDIGECPISRPGIVARLDAIRTIAAALATDSQPFRVTVLETLSGLDLAFEGVRKPGDRQRRAVTECVLKLKGIARVAHDGEILIEPQKPMLDFGGVAVSPPPGGFTQATKEAEDAIAALVLGHLAKAKRTADLFPAPARLPSGSPGTPGCMRSRATRRR